MSIFNQAKIPPFPKGTSLAGRTVLLTGASSGIGYVAAQELIKLNVSTLIIAVRNTKKGEDSKQSLLSDPTLKGTSTTIDVLQLDLNSFASVHSFVDSLKKKYDHIDHALLNAAMNVMNWEVTKDGHESNVQVNYLSNVLLGFLLLPLLRATTSAQGPSYLSFVGSSIDATSTLTKDDKADDDLSRPISYLQEKRSFKAADRYPDTKLLLSMFVRQMAKHTKATGAGKRDCIINVGCPGFTAQTGFDAQSTWLVRLIVGFLRRLVGRPLDAAARAIIFAGAMAKDDSRGELVTSNTIRPPLDIAINHKGKLLEESLWKDTVKFLESEAPGAIDYL